MTAECLIEVFTRLIDFSVPIETYLRPFYTRNEIVAKKKVNKDQRKDYPSSLHANKALKCRSIPKTNK